VLTSALSGEVHPPVKWHLIVIDSGRLNVLNYHTVALLCVKLAGIIVLLPVFVFFFVVERSCTVGMG